MRGFDITTGRFNPTTTSEDMAEKINLDGLGSTAAATGVVSYEVTGGITHLKGLSLSPLNELSKSPLIAFIRPLQPKL